MQANHILFDLDGTLTDPGEGITNSVAYALSKFGITVSDRTSLYSFIGPPLREFSAILWLFCPGCRKSGNVLPGLLCSPGHV